MVEEKEVDKEKRCLMVCHPGTGNTQWLVCLDAQEGSRFMEGHDILNLSARTLRENNSL